MSTTANDLEFVWLEITGRCQLECVHCYADSGPTGTHGTMTVSDWKTVLDDAARIRVSMVQFIGGEPTLHPELPELIDHALSHRLNVEIFSNLVHVPTGLWETFGRPGVRLATSWYSDDPDQHRAITLRSTHARTKANIAEAVRRSIPLRVGIVGVDNEQRTPQAREALLALGVTTIAYDDLREVGRGVRGHGVGVEQLCGNCANGVLAVSATGDVWPCVFSRWLRVGNVLSAPLNYVLASAAVQSARSELLEAFRDGREQAGAEACAPRCHPDCQPRPCQPTCAPRCSPSCGPCAPFKRCWPSYR